MLTAARDMTEFRNLEAQLRQAQKMEAVGRLAGGVAHDFNNMLGVILGYTDLALRRLNAQEPLYHDLQEVNNAARRSADLTRQLLAFSRKQIVTPRVINLNEAVTQQQKMLGRLIGEDIDLKFIPGPDLWNVCLDSSQVDQILANLAVNARDAIAGVGTVTMETANVTLDENYTRRYPHTPPGEYVMLAVTDSGHGMDRETLERIFEPFFTTKGEGQGTGLGLSTVYGIVKQNQGSIQAYSEPDRGTTIKIYIPRFLGEAVSVKPVKETPLSGSETVLIVEDEPQILLLAKRILEQHGYKTMAAGSPGEALLLLEKHPGSPGSSADRCDHAQHDRSGPEGPGGRAASADQNLVHVGLHGRGDHPAGTSGGRDGFYSKAFLGAGAGGEGKGGAGRVGGWSNIQYPTRNIQ